MSESSGGFLQKIKALVGKRDKTPPLTAENGYSIDSSVPPEYSHDLIGGKWELHISGGVKKPAEVVKIDMENGHTPVVVIYDVNRLDINTKGGAGKSLDLIQILPPNWKFQTVSSANLHYAAPEILDGIAGYEDFDPESKTITVGDVSNETVKPDTLSLSLL